MRTRYKRVISARSVNSTNPFKVAPKRKKPVNDLLCNAKKIVTAADSAKPRMPKRMRSTRLMGNCGCKFIFLLDHLDRIGCQENYNREPSPSHKCRLKLHPSEENDCGEHKKQQDKACFPLNWRYEDRKARE